MSVRSHALVFALVLASSLASFSAEARRHNNRNDNRGGGYNSNPNYQDNIQSNSSTAGADDSAIVTAVDQRKRLNFVEGNGMVVVKILPDDTSGLEHQKFIVRLSSGKTLQAVYNLDMCERVPVQVGDVVGLGGQFIWTNQGGLLHWLHKDPRHNRPDGYVLLNGKYYCK
jgi:hypothetical protein